MYDDTPENIALNFKEQGNKALQRGAKCGGGGSSSGVSVCGARGV